jgi:F-type H+-transporting ATPase subunit b
MTHNILAAGEEPNPLVPHLSEIILVLIIFGILYYLVWKYVVPRFEANFAARKDAIEGGIARAEAAQAEAAQALAEYQHQLADARGEAAQFARTAARKRSGSSRNCALRRSRSQIGSSLAAKSNCRLSAARLFASCGRRSAHSPWSCRRRSSVNNLLMTPG